MRLSACWVNPTPKTLDECFKALIEEMADVKLCIWVVEASRSFDLRCNCDRKRERWAQRILEARGETTKKTPKEKKTRQSEFLKLFPNAVRIGGTPDFCPRAIDTEYMPPTRCENISCWSCKEEYWATEVK